MHFNGYGCTRLSQYASRASASSEFGGGWSAAQATGAPSHVGCAVQMAGSWAPFNRDTTQNKLTLTFTKPVLAREVHVWEHANPRTAAGFVTSVVLRGLDGRSFTVWSGRDNTACGEKLSIVVTASVVTNTVELYTQTRGVAAWEYIDAVQLKGDECASTTRPTVGRQPVDLLANSRLSSQLDRVMGGRSTGAASLLLSSGYLFAGFLETAGGGFAYLRLSRTSTIDISRYAAIELVVDVHAQGQTPLAFQLELIGSGRSCSLVSSFALPLGDYRNTQLAKATLHAPLAAFQPKGPWWAGGRCSGSSTSLRSISAIQIGNYYQRGSYRLALHSMRAVDSAPRAPVGIPKLPLDKRGRQEAANFLRAALSRAEGLRGKGSPEASMAVAVLETSAWQVVRTDRAATSSARQALREAADAAAKLRSEGQSPERIVTDLQAKIKEVLRVDYAF
eukprot:CAMPEP_0119344448 /NCGR_PEP_ID=MMETSP1333-20130426/106977_1 /TAXON_ID=418940 /ORGANISM="Scyphosphaera apsteinii, Strain RCC1455" /LENGTH=448 /DNA_ID=CAMNT_0007356887 /DNA_START=481 /DNA_END=1827 /DNA_ORIENTATION=+